MALSGDEDDLFDATHSEPDNHVDIKKNLLSDLSEESPIKASEEFMAPPPVPDPAESPEKMCVFLRIRPLTNVEEMEEKRECVVVRDPTRVDMIAPKESKTYEHSAHGCGKVVSSFNFTRVYDEFTSQQKLFNDCMLSTIKDFVDGQNCLVFAYGVTNSGKTYTMLGPPKDQGIIPRSLDVIFNSIGDKQFEGADLKPQLYCEVKKLELKEMADADKFKTMIINAASRTTFDSTSLYASSDSLASQSSIGGESSVFEGADEDLVRTSISTECQGNIKFSIWVSFAEIYNEQIHDLLEPLAKSETLAKKRKILILREDKHGNPYIKDLRHIHVTSADEALKVLTFGQKNLQYACTKLNESSSRSHCIFTVKIVRVVDKLNPRKARMSQLSFCDLAGSERYTRTGNTGDRLKEAANINTSLLTLGRCIQLLRQNQIGRISKDRVVPFRDSKLTRLFQTYFSGKGKACMVVNVSPAVSSFDENIQALKFSSIARQVQFIADKVQHLPKPGKPRTELSLALEQGDDSRMTIAWAPPEELSEPSKLPQLTEEDESAGPRYAEYDSAIEKLKKALIETNELLKQERRMKKQMEANLRQEICQEMMEQITEIENHYEQELEEERMRCEEVVETKVNMVTSAIHKSVKRKRLEEEEIMQADKVKLDENESQIEDLQETITKLEEKLADATQTISQLGKQEPMAIEEPGDRESINALNDQICTLSESNIQLYAHGNELKGEILTLKAVSEEKDRKVEQLDTKIRMLTEQQAKMEKPDDDLTNNEIFINITTQLDEAKSVIEDKEKELADLRQTLEEAGETFQQKDSQITSLRTQLTGLQDEKENYVFNFGVKKTGSSIPSKLKNLLRSAKSKSPSTISISSKESQQGQPTPVSSTCSTPYLAMHTKSSLMRLRQAQVTVPKVDKCLDHSCFANTDNEQPGSNNKRDSCCLEMDTRATKKRKAATKKPKKRISLVIKRTYETRSRIKKK